MILIPDNHLGDYLVSSMGYSGTDRWLAQPAEASAAGSRATPGPRALDALTMLSKGAAAYLGAVGSGLPTLPFFLMMDLRLLAELGHEFTYTDRDIPGFDRMLRARYENEILNRLLREHRVQQALELLAFHRARGADDPSSDTLAFDLRAARLAHILAERLAPHWPTHFMVNAAHMRGRVVEIQSLDAITQAHDRWQEAAAALAPEAPDFAGQIDDFIHSATGSKRAVVPVSWVKIVETQDLFELEHIEALDREYLRLGVRNIIEVMESLPELDPHDVELREEANEVESRFMDDSYYPTGGVSELTNRGSFENLVLSELIYMGEGSDEIAPEPGLARRGIDLFDLRFVEGELLFYTRDSGQLFRKRRTLRLILDMRRTLNLKYPEHPYQLGTMVAGLVLALVRDLILLFNNDALLFCVHLLANPEDRDAQKLSETLAILLEAPIQHGALEIRIDARLDPLDLGSHTRKTYAITFTSDPRAVDQIADRIDDLKRANPPLFPTVVDLSGASEPAHENALRLELTSTALQTLKHEILLDVMHSRKRRARQPEEVDAA